MNGEPVVTVPVWMALAFAAWTLLLLFSTIGVYRFSQIFSGRGAIGDFRADQVEGADWYRRSMRAHANCVENLPVFAVIVLALCVSGTGGSLVDGLSIGIMVARVMQSLVHIGLPQTNRVVSVRFTFFFVQLMAFATLIVLVVRHAAATP
jgi:uncharacterized membrane protein YecN with MAPEG domain